MISKWRKKHPTLCTTTIQQVTAEYNTALTMLRTARQQASQLREEFLDEKAKMYEALELQGKAKIVHRLK